MATPSPSQEIYSQPLEILACHWGGGGALGFAVMQRFCLIFKCRFAEIFTLRWLNWIFLGGYLPSLSINYVAMSKDMEKRFPQLYYIKMKISYDLDFIAIGVAMAT